jgi:uncharacterized glyoxalase superfamily protein PhnB
MSFGPMRGKPDGYHRVTPALVVDGAVKALEFYAEVFGATERMRFPGPGGTIAHAESRRPLARFSAAARRP